MASYEDLKVFQRSYETALRVHRLTKDHEWDDVVRQIRRATKSIPANIAEGLSAVNSTAEAKRFLGIAIRSCNEVRLWLDFCHDLEYLEAQQCKILKSEYHEYGAMLYALWKNYGT